VTAIAGVVLVPLRAATWAVQHDAMIYLTPDLNETLLGSMAAHHFDQLVGEWSRLGLYHPGPFWFYWTAPFVALAHDQPSGLIAAVLVLVAICGVAIAFVVARSSGPLLGGLAAVVVLIAVHQLSLNGLAYPWNPTVLILPVAAGLVCAAGALSTGSLAMAAAAALLGAFVAQAHLGALLAGGFIVAVALAAALRRTLQTGIAADRWRLLGVVAIAIAPWIPVLVDQASGAGNLGAVARYIATGSVNPRFPPALPSQSIHLSAPGVLTHVAAMTSLVEHGAADWGGAYMGAGYAHRPSLVSLLVLVGLVGVAAAGSIRNFRFGTRERANPAEELSIWLCRLALAGLAIEILAAWRARNEFRYYLIAGSSGVGVALWLGVGLTLATAARRVLRERRSSAASVGRLVGGVGLVGCTLIMLIGAPWTLSAMRVHYDYNSSTIVALLHRAPDGSFVASADAYGVQIGDLQQIVAALEHHGRRIRIEGPGASHFSDRQRNYHGGVHRIRLLKRTERPPKGCAVVGQVTSGHVCVT
jgi:hypothetical protein